MAITERQLKQRKKYVGSSDIAALLGVSPYSTAYDVWAQKCGLLVDGDDKATPDMVLGTCLEDGIRTRAKEDLGQIRRGGFRVLKGTKLGVNVDGIRISTGEPVEIKTAKGWANKADWGDPGTDQVPFYTICQTHGHMLATRKDRCWVPALVNGEYYLYVVDFNKPLGELILAATEEFWRFVVDRKAPPAPPSLDVVKRLIREPNKMVNISDDLIEGLVTARAEATAAGKRKDEATAKVLAAMGDAEAGLTAGLGAVTYYTEHRNGYTVGPKDCRILRYKKKGL